MASKFWNAHVAKGKRQTAKVIQMRTEKMQEALTRFNNMKENGVNFSDVFLNTIEAFKVNMKAGFNAQESPDIPPQRWALLSKKYTWRKYHTKGRRIANLILTGTLRDAVYGGPGWYQQISPNRTEFGITGIPYAAIHQYGGMTGRGHKARMPARRYFLAKDNKLPSVVINYLIGQIEKKLIGEV